MNCVSTVLQRKPMTTDMFEQYMGIASLGRPATAARRDTSASNDLIISLRSPRGGPQGSGPPPGPSNVYGWHFTCRQIRNGARNFANLTFICTEGHNIIIQTYIDLAARKMNPLTNGKSPRGAQEMARPLLNRDRTTSMPSFCHKTSTCPALYYSNRETTGY